jgi:hypothetical protein
MKNEFRCVCDCVGRENTSRVKMTKLKLCHCCLENFKGFSFYRINQTREIGSVYFFLGSFGI